MNNFAVFILTHGRANNVKTYKTLRKYGYTGKIVLIVDDADKQQKEYIKNFNNKSDDKKTSVHIFSKKNAINITDACDNFKNTKSVVYARNYAFKIAKTLKYDYFLVLDDDYSEFRYAFDNKTKYITAKNKVSNLDKLFSIFLKFYIKTPSLTLCMAQAGDFIGGAGSNISKYALQGKFMRKAMNSFFCSTKKPFKYLGQLNDDVNTYVKYGLLGKLMITCPLIRLTQSDTQQQTGGLTDIYLDFGTYTKSFYSVMIAPASVKIITMGVNKRRIHHKIKANATYPKILSETLKK